MAVIWRKQINESLYEIRTAGGSVRLYTDGIFHSQWNPNQPIGGNIWELLFLPALFVDPHRIKRVLVLGVGGGAVINLLNRFISPGSITGLDLDAVHLKLARRYFKVATGNTRLLHAEARQWVAGYTGSPFDLVIEDLFCADDAGDPVRAIHADNEWLMALRKITSRQGILVMNHESRRQLKKTAGNVAGTGIFKFASQLTTQHYENAIGVFSDNPLERKKLDAQLLHYQELDRRRRSCKLDFVFRRL